MAESNFERRARRQSRKLAERLGCRIERECMGPNSFYWWVHGPDWLYDLCGREDPCEGTHACACWGEVLAKLEDYQADMHKAKVEGYQRDRMYFKREDYQRDCSRGVWVRLQARCWANSDGQMEAMLHFDMQRSAKEGLPPFCEIDCDWTAKGTARQWVSLVDSWIRDEVPLALVLDAGQDTLPCDAVCHSSSTEDAWELARRVLDEREVS